MLDAAGGGDGAGSYRNRRRWLLSREDWAQSALQTLAEDSPRRVVIDRWHAASARRKELYWHYANRDDLIEATLELWEHTTPPRSSRRSRRSPTRMTASPPRARGARPRGSGTAAHAGMSTPLQTARRPGAGARHAGPARHAGAPVPPGRSGRRKRAGSRATGLRAVHRHNRSAPRRSSPVAQRQRARGRHRAHDPGGATARSEAPAGPRRAGLAPRGPGRWGCQSAKGNCSSSPVSCMARCRCGETSRREPACSRGGAVSRS